MLSERLSLESSDGELLLGEATGSVTASNGGSAVSRTSDNLGVIGQLGRGEACFGGKGLGKLWKSARENLKLPMGT